MVAELATSHLLTVIHAEGVHRADMIAAVMSYDAETCIDLQG